MVKLRGALAVAAAATAVLTMAGPAVAWPERTVTMLVPFAPGGITDTLARITAERLQARLKQPFVLENASGATGTIAASRVARAEPDGYTLFFATVTQITVAPFTHNITYDPIKDFKPISVVGMAPFVITVGESVPARTLPELIAHVKANPGKLSYGSAGAGSLTHIAAAQFTKAAGIEMNHVPYKGVAPAFQDLVAGHISMMSPSPVELRPFLEQGKLKPLAITNTQRTGMVPNVPAITEFLPGNAPVVTWNGVMAPAKTPASVIDILSRELRAAAQDPAFLERLAKIGVDPVLHMPDDFARIISGDLERFRVIIRDLGLKAAQ